MALIDRFIIEFDTALRSVVGGAHAHRPTPGSDTPSAGLLDAKERAHAAGLMRVNHVGEVCAQALYQSQKLVARNPEIRQMLEHSGQEEMDHLAWCESRIKQLGGRTSVLNPVFYAGSFSLGLLAGALGDRWNLGFVAETEKQVEAHLASHLQILAPADQKTRKIIEQMQTDEAAHAKQARDHGAAELPAPINFLMRNVAKVMTTSSYHL